MILRAALSKGCGPFRLATRLPWLPVFALAACGPADNQPGVGDVTVGEARALNEAAEMLDNRSIALPEEGNAAMAGNAR